nr:PREDICTED: amyloid beta A4 precursor protein-binding family A member 2-like isoform X2 [Paralichthys olivaceus]
MAHGKNTGTISKILAPNPPPCPGTGLTKQSHEEQQGSVREASEQPPHTFKDDNTDQLTPPASAKHFYMSSDPSPEDMEDTCSEYDNVGSDVEQDYDEVLHLNREGMVDMRYYKQYCPEDAGYIKHAGGDNINENSSAVDQFTPRVRHSTEICEGSQSNTKPLKTGHRFRSHCVPIPVDEAEKGAEKGQENRFVYSDGDEIEEVLDGARFIEDLEETVNTVQRPTSLYPGNDNEKIRKGGDEREREDVTRVTRNPNIQGASKKCESSHMGSKERERQGKGRGRRGTAEDTEHIVSGIKRCSTNSTEQRPKASVRDCKKAAVRTKAKSGSSKQHPPPPPRHSHAQSPADAQKPQSRQETPPVPRPSPPSANGQENKARVTKPLPAPQHTPQQQREPLEERQRRPEKTQQGEKPSTAVMPEDVVEQLRRSHCQELVPAEMANTPKKTQEASSFPSFEDVPGPCEPEDLIDGIIFAANYLGCTQVLSDKNPSKSIRMSQAQEAVSRIKSQDEDSQMMTEVDLFISTKAVKVLNADTQLHVEKQKGESLGVVIVESGWGSILPTVILASMLNSGPAARSGKLSVGDQIMSINDTSLVGLPLATCQGIIKGLKNQVKVKLSIVSCPPVTTVLIKRPDLKFQLGFSVQNGIICSLMRGGIAERGGVRVGHRIIEINGQSVVAMAHEKIVQNLSVSVGEINMKTMPAVMFRLLTGQETPVYI